MRDEADGPMRSADAIRSMSVGDDGPGPIGWIVLLSVVVIILYLLIS